MLLFFLSIHLGEMMFINIIVLLVISKSQDDTFYLLSHHHPIRCCEVSCLHLTTFICQPHAPVPSVALTCSLPYWPFGADSSWCSPSPLSLAPFFPSPVRYWFTLLLPLLLPLCLHYFILSVSYPSLLERPSAPWRLPPAFFFFF